MLNVRQRIDANLMAVSPLLRLGDCPDSSTDYAAFFDSASISSVTKSDTSNSRVVTSAAIVGDMRSVRWILMKLYAK